MLSFALRPDSVAFAGIEQFTKAEAVKWLDGEEQNALAIAEDAQARGLDVRPAYVRAEACSLLRGQIRKDKTRKVFDLETELGTIQQMLGRSLS